MNAYNSDLRAHNVLPAATSRLGNAIAVGLLLAVIFTALAHGAVEPWSVAVFQGIMIVLVLMCGLKIATSGRLEIYVPAPGLPLAALLAAGLLQSFAFTDNGGRTWSFSVDVESTRATVLALFFLVVAFLIAANLFERREAMQSLVWFLVIYGLAMALFGLVQHFTWNGRFYWIRPTTAEHSMPFGPFVNRNHFAGYMELLMPLPVALVITRAVRKDVRVFLVLAATVMGIAAVASLSRGGMVSIAAEMIFLAMLGIGERLRQKRARATEEDYGADITYQSRRSRIFALPRPVVFTVMLATLICAGILWIGSEPVINRLLPSQTASERARSETFYSSRGWIWRDTLTMIVANPILGVGLGAYETAYPIYSHDDGSMLLGQSFSVDRVHNDYLQILSDCGVVGGAIAVWFIVLVFRAVARGVKTRDPLMAAVALGSGASIFGMLVHSLFDFNLQLPSNALLFLLLIAVTSRIGCSLKPDRATLSANPHLAPHERGV